MTLSDQQPGCSAIYLDRCYNQAWHGTFTILLRKVQHVCIVAPSGYIC